MAYVSQNLGKSTTSVTLDEKTAQSGKVTLVGGSIGDVITVSYITNKKDWFSPMQRKIMDRHPPAKPDRFSKRKAYYG